MSSDIAVSVENLGKCYRIYDHPSHRILESIDFRPKRYAREFWSLRNIQFDLQKGETLGIVGRNGSGKSTLLQLLAGILQPTEGRVETNGRIGALLELGSGFNPEFTGIENIYMNGALLGINKKELDKQIDNILDFANIGSFSTQAVKTYSSGMTVRLAFAVQAVLSPEILIVDEALAVGDELFQKKCFAHLNKLKEAGTSILLVTHNSSQILHHCDSAILLHKGEMVTSGNPKLVTTTYQRLLSSKEETDWKTMARQIEATLEQKCNSSKTNESKITGTNLKPETTISYPCHGGKITDIELRDNEGELIESISSDESFEIRFFYEVEEDFQNLQMACHIASSNGMRITGQGFPGQELSIPNTPAGSRFSVSYFFEKGLQPGIYFVGGGFWRKDLPSQYIHRVLDKIAFRVNETGRENTLGLCNLTAKKPVLEGLASI